MVQNSSPLGPYPYQREGVKKKGMKCSISSNIEMAHVIFVSITLART
jgi:hypothetical protein